MIEEKPFPEAELCVELPVEHHEVQWMGATVWVTGKLTMRLDDAIQLNTPDGPIVLPRTAVQLVAAPSEKLQ